VDLSSYFTHTNGGDTAFSVEAPKIKFGTGVLTETGSDAKALGMQRVAVFTDSRIRELEPVHKVTRALKQAGIDLAIFDETEVEPTDRSFKTATAFAAEGKFDGFVSVGGGSVMDTAKAANLYSTFPDEFLAYVNAPIGKAQPVPGPLKPHIACPTTFGTASECTGIAVFDLLEMTSKTGIASPRLRPSLGILDPANLSTLPKEILAANGFDVFSHSVESITARPFTHRPAPPSPSERPLSQGANPYSDINCLEAIRLIGNSLVDAVNTRDEKYFRPLMFAGMLAGIGFGNAGCHLPHGMSYAVSGLVKGYQPAGWPPDHPMVPHGISVIVNSPAVFQYTAAACPERHMIAAEAMGADTRDAPMAAAGTLLADRVIDMMRRTGMPNGLVDVGYSEKDLDELTAKAFPQKRLLDNAPLPIDRNQLKALFKDALTYW